MALQPQGDFNLASSLERESNNDNDNDNDNDLTQTTTTKTKTEKENSSSPSPPPSPGFTTNPEPFSNLKTDERYYEDQKRIDRRKAQLVMGEPLGSPSPPTTTTATATATTTTNEKGDVEHQGQVLRENEELLKDLDENETFDLELTHQRLRTLRGLGLHRFTQLQRICLRQNLLTSLSFVPLPVATEPLEGRTLASNEESTSTIPTISSESVQASIQQRDEVDEDELDDPDAKKKEDEYPYNEQHSHHHHHEQLEEEIEWPLRGLKELEEVDLYDNSIKSIRGLEDLPSLTSLDLSFNLLRSISEMDDDSPNSPYAYPKLSHLYLIQNKLPKIHGVRHRTSLTYLEYGGNRIRSIENLPISSNLRSLFLGKNKITKIEGLEGLTGLRTLSIQSNRLTKIEGLETLTELDELYLSHNGLTSIEGLEKNTKITTLDIGHNQINLIPPKALSNLSSLTEFWANNNLLTELPRIESQELETVYFEGNPLQKSFAGNYERKIKLMYQGLKQIDAIYLKRT